VNTFDLRQRQILLTGRLHAARFVHHTALQRRFMQLLFTLAVLQVSVSAQVVALPSVASDPLKMQALIAPPPGETEQENELMLAVRAITALRRVNDDVIVYRSLNDFEVNGRIARVSYEDFQKTLKEVSDEVEPILYRLPQSRLKMDINNALYSYRDGGFWWGKIHQSRVVSISKLSFARTNITPTETLFMSTVPYTVAIHWRQASEYLKRAEKATNYKKFQTDEGRATQ